MLTANDSDDLDAWVQLIQWPNLGRDSLRKLLAAFGSVRAVVQASPASRQAVVGSRTALSPVPHADHADHLRKAIAWLQAGARRRLMTIDDADFPGLLLQTVDPPLWMFLEGDASLLQQQSVALVGSRHATPQGLQNAQAFARDLARQGWVIVSGLAAGIDTAAHEGALAAEGGTIAVVGTGLDQVYPRANQNLALRIAHHGLMVSEFPLGTPPLRNNFPLRNRIIATLTRGTLVVEAAPQSGSLITARQAVEAGREVFAVPGSIHSPQSRGCHVLLKQGAKLVETAQDVIEELGAIAGRDLTGSATASTAEPDQPAEPHDVVLRALGHDPATLDALMARCGWPAHELSARLLELEMTGLVARLPGGLYQRLSTT
jgi:DNA processing protein